MSAASLLARTPSPTDTDIDRAMNGNLCRCATYLRIRQAIHRAAAMAADGNGRSPDQDAVEPIQHAAATEFPKSLLKSTAPA
jgi:isoquinoline 1-oxidoreductase alpha subunit